MIYKVLIFSTFLPFTTAIETCSFDQAVDITCTPSSIAIRKNDLKVQQAGCEDVAENWSDYRVSSYFLNCVQKRLFLTFKIPVYETI